MSGFTQVCLDTETNGYGDFILNESVSRNQIIYGAELVMKLHVFLPVIIDSIENPKWQEYLNNFHKTLAIVGDILLRK